MPVTIMLTAPWSLGLQRHGELGLLSSAPARDDLVLLPAFKQNILKEGRDPTAFCACRAFLSLGALSGVDRTERTCPERDNEILSKLIAFYYY